MKTVRSMAVVALITGVALLVAVSPSYATNVALGASYEYGAGWPGRPNIWDDKTPPSVLTDGVDGSSGALQTSVYENANEILVAYNIDLGKDYALTQLKALAVQSPWSNNVLSSEPVAQFGVDKFDK